MDEKVLNSVKNSYERLKILHERDMKDFERIHQLEQNALVREYIELSSRHSGDSEEYWSDNELLELAMESHEHEIIETNGIYFCIGLVYLADYAKNEYKRYINLEQPHDNILLPIASCYQFENTHEVIFTNSRFPFQEYYKLRRIFFQTAIKEGQEKARLKVLKKLV